MFGKEGTDKVKVFKKQGIYYGTVLPKLETDRYACGRKQKLERFLC